MQLELGDKKILVVDEDTGLADKIEKLLAEQKEG